MHILLVEDEPEISRLACDQMVKLGHRVEVASSLEEAERLFQKFSLELDLVIADHRLPDGHGIDFVLDLSCRKVKAKLAVVSGVLTASDRLMLAGQGIPYFLKPVLYSHVVNSLRTAPSITQPVLDEQDPSLRPAFARPLPPRKKGLTGILFGTRGTAPPGEGKDPPSPGAAAGETH